MNNSKVMFARESVNKFYDDMGKDLSYFSKFKLFAYLEQCAYKTIILIY